MGSGFKKKETVDMGNYAPNDREQDAKDWCMKNNIYVSPTAKNASEWYLTIINNSKVTQSPLTYKKVEIWKELFKFYTYYYDKYSGAEVIKKVEPKKVIKEEIEKPKQISNYELF
jgi:hypothetical protein